MSSAVEPAWSQPAARVVALEQGLTLVHYSAHRRHILWDTLGA
jgi:hypothetical protein